ncbi:hypothetical protein [Citreimonas salinaria]|uniref:Uncharacterized protein n=1 Tax=Citreimonas salinaria TaxID=321339 RepID=A0A1H3N378_9RHOB|nr:hypothetical protein [Citreimonas salinaria]SDY83411.1 hypothetical protein SAMN05444340_1207 [Citreimonas salinaria]
MIALLPVFLLASGALWTATLALAEGMAQIVLVHASIVVFAALVRSCAAGTESIDWYLLPVCLIGPLGVIAAATTYVTRAHHRIGDEQLQAWYEELRGATDASRHRTLANDVTLGRINPQAGASMRSAVEIFREGTFKDRQRVLLWIARRKDALLRSLLDDAVRCDDTIIRSQAASLIVHFYAAERSLSALEAKGGRAERVGASKQPIRSAT